MSSAAAVVVNPNVLLGRSSSFTPSPTPSRARFTNPALKLRAATLSWRTPSLSGKQSQPLQQFTLSASVEDTASTKVDEAVKAAESSSHDPDGGLSPEAESEVKQASEALEEQAEKSKAILEEVVGNLKDVSKLQEATKQVYSDSAEKAIGVLRDTTEQLREQAEKARAVLLETAVKGKENLTMFAENSPDPLLKDIAETAVDAHLSEKSRKGARIHDFCLGIPYGSILLGGGFLWFLLTGSTAAIRFGVFLGGLVLAMSVTSLKVWKRGESSMSYILGQGAIATLLLVRECRRFSEVGKPFPHGVMAALSAAMLVFYTYVYISGGNPPKKAKVST